MHAFAQVRRKLVGDHAFPVRGFGKSGPPFSRVFRGTYCSTHAVLLGVTGVDLDYDQQAPGADLAEAAGRWESWYLKNGIALVLDPKSGRIVTGR